MNRKPGSIPLPVLLTGNPWMVTLRRYLMRRLLLALVTLLRGGRRGLSPDPHPAGQSRPRCAWARMPRRSCSAQMEKQMGLDKPLPVQFVSYVVALLRGDMGKSWRTGQPVLTDLMQRLPATLELAITATLLAILVGLALGILGATRQNRPLDRVIRLLTILGASTALFWLALVFIYIFYYRLGWAPSPHGPSRRRAVDARAPHGSVCHRQPADGELARAGKQPETPRAAGDHARLRRQRPDHEDGARGHARHSARGLYPHSADHRHSRERGRIPRRPPQRNGPRSSPRSASYSAT